MADEGADRDGWIHGKFEEHEGRLDSLTDEVRRVKRRMGTMRDAIRTAIDNGRRSAAVQEQLATVVAGSADGGQPGLTEDVRGLKAWRKNAGKFFWLLAAAAVGAVSGALGHAMHAW